MISSNHRDEIIKLHAPPQRAMKQHREKQKELHDDDAMQLLLYVYTY